MANNLTNREIVSNVVNALRALQVDDRISKRYVLSILKYYTSVFLRRENDQMRLWKQSDLWTTIPCVEMVDASSIECCNIKLPKFITFMKSKQPLPSIYSSTGGLLIKEVFSIDGSFEFVETTPSRFKDIQNREFKNKNNKYFWIENNHLVIPDSRVKKVMIIALFEDPCEANKLNTCTNQKEIQINGLNPLDQNFICPSYLLQIVIDSTLQNLFNFYKRNQLDEVPNLDTNIKSELQTKRQ